MIQQRAPRITEEQKEKIKELYRQNSTYKEICEKCNCSVRTVQKYLGFNYGNNKYTKIKPSYNITKIDDSSDYIENLSKDTYDDFLMKHWKYINESDERVKKGLES